METIYDWLLHNTGNESNYYTILNTQRNGTDSLDIMARTADFDVVNLLIQHRQRTDSAVTDSTESQDDSYIFSDEQQVIMFIAEGKTPESQTSDMENGIRVLITEPTGEAGDITFPPAQS